MTQREHIKELERRLKNADNLAEVANYFLDHLGEEQSFIKQSKPMKNHPLLKAVVENVVKTYLRRNMK